ncbi:MAG: carbohydrate kinase family protein [Albidovulum sp.]|nr:carbohydrate kinase family protein [Albidovulum sp.]MDE0531198.1 carbohydrate kinase family protein [Albidovulum sp.]
MVCFGNFSIDDIFLPDGNERRACVGGDAVFAALGARLWEPSTEIVAPVGNDLPDAVLQSIADAGFRVDLLGRRPYPTLHNRVVYDSCGGREWTLFASEEIFHELSPRPSDIPEQFLEADAFLVLAMTLTAQETLLEFLRKSTRAVLALDLQEDYIFGNEDRILKLLTKTDIFLPSAEEVHRLIGIDDWSSAARYFASLGPSLVIIKLGNEGCLVFDANQDTVLQIPPFTVSDILDTTGAGDSFCGGFVAALTGKRWNVKKAARAGAISASYAIASYGIDSLLAATAKNAMRQLATWRPSTG